MTEKNIRKCLIELAKKGGFLVQPIESGITNIGIPDLFFRTKKRDGWAELKVAVETKIGSHLIVRMRPGQLRWLRDYATLGGRALMLLYVEPDALFVLEPHQIRGEYWNFNELTSIAGDWYNLPNMTSMDLEALFNGRR